MTRIAAVVDVQWRGGGLPGAEDVKATPGAMCVCHKLQANDMATRRRACASGRPEMAKRKRGASLKAELKQSGACCGAAVHGSNSHPCVMASRCGSQILSRISTTRPLLATLVTYHQLE